MFPENSPMILMTMTGIEGTQKQCSKLIFVQKKKVQTILIGFMHTPVS